MQGEPVLSRGPRWATGNHSAPQSSEEQSECQGLQFQGHAGGHGRPCAGFRVRKELKERVPSL